MVPAKTPNDGQPDANTEPPKLAHDGSSPESRLYITRYVDQWGNTRGGCVVMRCSVDPKSGKYTVLEPHAAIAGCQYVDKRSVAPLPDDSAHRVGFYTIASHYKILKSIGQIDRLAGSSRAGYEEMLPEADRDHNRFTWYSDGPKLHPGISQTQTELY